MTGGLFAIEMLPACEGDCLWLSWGDRGNPRHALIDGGRKSTTASVRRKLQGLPADRRRLELLIVSHIDRDHIEGVLELLGGGLDGVEIGDVWFNGHAHLREALEAAGPVQGEKLTSLIGERGLPWNAAFGGKAVVVPDEGPLPKLDLADGLTVTLLSPTRQKLGALLPEWNAEIAKAGLVKPEDAAPQGPPGWERAGAIDVAALADSPFRADGAAPNGSSIAVLAEFEGRKALLAADAHADVVAESLARLPGDGPLRVDVLKVAHHGSAANTSAALLAKLDCGRFLVSTNGSYFNHPDAESIARILVHGGARKQLMFNYRTPQTTVWDNPIWFDTYGYEALYPSDEAAGGFALEI